jgi:hypothetical protein
MKVGQVDLAQRVIRLDPGTTKNGDGREVFMTDALHHLLSGCVRGKRAEEAVFSRPNGIAVRSFRDAWGKACINAGVGQHLCLNCATSVTNAAPRGSDAEAGKEPTRITGKSRNRSRQRFRER